jgi:hypothetical protein
MLTRNGSGGPARPTVGRLEHAARQLALDAAEYCSE